MIQIKLDQKFCMKADGCMGGMAQIRCGKVVYPPDHHMAQLRHLFFLFSKHLFAGLQEDLIFDGELGLYKSSACDILIAYDAFDIRRKHQIGNTGTNALQQG